MVQAVLISNDEIKARCADMAKQIFDDYKGKKRQRAKLTILGNPVGVPPNLHKLVSTRTLNDAATKILVTFIQIIT